jgi:hypothetical protein
MRTADGVKSPVDFFASRFEDERLNESDKEDLCHTYTRQKQKKAREARKQYLLISL